MDTHAKETSVERQMITSEESAGIVSHLKYPFFINLLNMSSLLLSMHQLNELLDNLMLHVVQALPLVDGGMIWLYDRRLATLRMVSTYGLPLDSSLLNMLRHSQIVTGEELVGQAFQKNALLWFQGQTKNYLHTLEYLSDRNKMVFQELYEHLPPTMTMVCVPLKTNNELLGTMQLFNFAQLEEVRFEEPQAHRDITVSHPLVSSVYGEVLHTLSSIIARAIKNAQLYEESQLERQKLNAVINTITEGVVLCDRDGYLVLANEAALSLLILKSVPFHQPLSEMGDFYDMRNLEGRPLPIDQLPLARALSGEIFHDYRVLLRGVSGHDSVMSFSGAPMHADDGNTIDGAVVIFRDITAHQKLERVKDEFLAVAAHELRSPLAAVRGYADTLLKREQQRNEADSRDLQGLTMLSRQVGHMLRLVDNLLDVSRIDAGQIGLQMQSVNLVWLITQVLDQNRPSAHHELLLDTEYAELMVRCDPMRIQQVLTNLISNAMKYSPPATPITIYLTIGEGQEASAGGLQRNILVKVADAGVWIPPDQRERLFQRYYRADGRRIEGLGLGLYLSRQFVLMHGGRIWIESIEGKGNIFSFTLPMGN